MDRKDNTNYLSYHLANSLRHSQSSESKRVRGIGQQLFLFKLEITLGSSWSPSDSSCYLKTWAFLWLIITVFISFSSQKYLPRGVISDYAVRALHIIPLKEHGYLARNFLIFLSTTFCFPILPFCTVCCWFFCMFVFNGSETATNTRKLRERLHTGQFSLINFFI